MVILSAFKGGVSPPKVALYGGLPCTYLAWKYTLRNGFAKIGFDQNSGNMVTAIMLVCSGLLFFEKGDADLIAKIFSIPCLLIGLVGYVSQDTLASTIYGVAKFEGAKTDILVKSTMGVYITWGVFAVSLLFGKDWTEALGYAALWCLVQDIDTLLISKDVEKLGSSPVIEYFYTLINAGVAAGCLSSVTESVEKVD